MVELQNQIMKSVIKFCLVICCYFSLIASPLAQSYEQVVQSYIQDLKESSSVEDILRKYHSTAFDNQELLEHIKTIISDRKKALQESNTDETTVKAISKEEVDNYPFLKGLNWENGQVYVVYTQGERLMTCLVEQQKITSTIIMSKGKMKYFMKL